MTTNSHMFTVRGTTFGAFCAASFFPPLLYPPRRWVLWKSSCSKQELPRQYCNSCPTPHPPAPPLLSFIIEVCLRECMKCVHPYVCVCVCVCSMKGARAAEVQSLVHVLKCSPRDGPYYPCLLHQQGPGARAGSWSFVSKQMEMGRGEEKWRIRENRGGGGGGRGGGLNGGWRRGGEGERVSLFSLSAVLKTTSPHNASAAADGPPLIQTHARTICTSGLS